MKTIPTGYMLVAFFRIWVLPGGIHYHAFLRYQINPVTSTLVRAFVGTTGFLEAIQQNDIGMKIVGTIYLGELVSIVSSHQNFTVFSSDDTNCHS